MVNQLPPLVFLNWVKNSWKSSPVTLSWNLIDLICSAIFNQINEPSDPSSFDNFTQANTNFSFIFPHIVSTTIRCYLIADWYAKFMFTLVGILCSRMTAGKPFLFQFHFYFYVRSCATVITVVSKQLSHCIIWVSFSRITEFSFWYS